MGATGKRGALLAAAVLLAFLALGARVTAAQAAPSYGDRAKSIILQLLSSRAFEPERGCDWPAPCGRLLSDLREGKFAVVEPIERSNRPDMPSYLALRRRCPSLDLAHVKTAHRIFTATRNFAIYRLDASRSAAPEILIFHAQHYVALGSCGPDAASGSGPTAPWPGAFMAIRLRGCRMVSTAISEDGDHFARHNTVEDADYASELVKMGDRYFVLNLVPIAGVKEPKETWWYRLELWDLGPRADADLRRQRRVYSFGAKPPVTYPSPGHSTPGEPVEGSPSVGSSTRG